MRLFIKKKFEVVLLLGTNLGSRENNLQLAISLLTGLVGNLIKQSSIYETAAWGLENQPNFLNQIIILSTSQSPKFLMKTILKIEKKMGRERLVKMGPRIIDIDILFYENRIINKPSLTIPHPRIQFRRFVLEPLNELQPNYVHPILNKSVKDLLIACTDTLNVKKF